MDVITPDIRIADAEEHLRSLVAAVKRLRRKTENLLERIEAGEEASFDEGSRQARDAERLVLSCQKVEQTFVQEQSKQAGIAQCGYALDLVQARFEIGCRLARLRTAEDSG